MVLEWNYMEFKKFERFIKEYDEDSKIFDFLREKITFLEEKSKKEMQDEIIGLPREEQLLILFLKEERIEFPLKNLQLKYMKYCEEFFRNLKNHNYEQKIWSKKLKFLLGSKENLVKGLQSNIVKMS